MTQAETTLTGRQALAEAPARPPAPEQTPSRPTLDISIVMPCLNEEEGVGICVAKARGWLQRSGYSGEIVVVDNGSTDASVERAREAGARVIREPRRGYGRAYLTGLGNARGRWIVMGDADDTYDFSNLDTLVRPLQEGADLVIANRFKGGIAEGAMPWTHRYIGTPAINLLMGIFTGARVSDSQSGFRAFTQEAYQRMGMRSEGMEFASEMVVRSARQGLHITEVPMPYLPRQGESKLRTFRDGWRHLRYLLLCTPDVLFMAPGALLFAVGIVTAILSLVSPSGLEVGSVTWQPVFASTIFLVVGTNALALGLLSKRQAARRGLVPRDGLTAAFERHFHLEGVLAASAALVAAGLALDGALFVAWLRDADFPRTLQLAGIAQSLLIVGGNIALAAFLAVMIEESDEEAAAGVAHGSAS